jgi:hypothetical protein
MAIFLARLMALLRPLIFDKAKPQETVTGVAHSQKSRPCLLTNSEERNLHPSQALFLRPLPLVRRRKTPFRPPNDGKKGGTSPPLVPDWELISSFYGYYKISPLGKPLNWAEPLLRKPDYRVPTAIPTNWCTNCQLTLRTAEEYRAHVQLFPTHYVKPIARLVCPECGSEVKLEGGCFFEHWVGYPQRKCPESGITA